MNSFRRGPFAESAGDLLRIPFLDLNGTAVRRVRIKRGIRSGNIKRDMMRLCKQRHPISADLIRRIAVGGNAVRPYDHQLNAPLPHDLRRHIVTNRPNLYSGPVQFPGCKTGSLQQRTGLIRIHPDPPPRLMGGIYRSQRGPVIAGAVKQFWEEVAWGEMDVMVIDMPPGTGDVPLTVFQSLPIDGVVVVTSPQELVGMVVQKAVNMANMMHIPVLGVVENYSYFECPDCGKRHNLFGDSHIETVAQKNGIDTVCRIPINPKLAAACDAGLIELYEGDWLDALTRKIESL